MTALDDALAQASVVFASPELVAKWKEEELGAETFNEDAATRLTTQATGTYTVNHSLDDGLPDPVTMTTGNDASGKLTAGLNGKPGMVLATSGQRAFTTTAQSNGFYGAAGAILTGPIPNNAVRGDYLVCAIITDSITADPIQSGADDDTLAWTYLGSITSGGNTMQAYGAIYWPGRPALMLEAASSWNYVMQTMAFWAQNPIGYPMAFRVTDVASFSESTNRTSHPISASLTKGRGYQLGIWGSGSAVGPWAATAGGTEWGEKVGSGLDLMFATSALIDNGTNTLTATTTTTTASAVVLALAVSPYERPVMDARQYWSPFNKNSPVYGYDRDTSDVTMSMGVLTATGRVDTSLFAGIMDDITISGRQAQLDATSKARIDLNTSVTLPMVYGNRENCSIDFVVAYLMARGGKFAGPAPNEYTQAWTPMYGSTHSAFGGDYYYNFGLYNEASTGGSWLGLKPPKMVAGPYSSAMYAQQSSTRAEEVKCTFIRPESWSDFSLPYLAPGLIGNNDPSNTSQIRAERFTKTGNKVRFSCWVRGDAVQAAPSYMSASDNDFITNFYNYITDQAGNFLGYIRFYISSSNRALGVQAGSTVGGFTDVTFSSVGTLPTDGTWHFFGWSMDFASGRCDFTFDGNAGFSTVWASNGNNVTGQLPSTYQEGFNNGWGTSTILRAHVPISDTLVDFGATFHTGDWAMFYPTPKAPGATAIVRPTLQPLQAISTDAPVTAWDTLADIAQSSLAAYRADELDRFNFLPLSYFGEAAQLVSQGVADTEVTAGDLDITQDSSKSRNSVTVQFPETMVDTFISPVLSLSTVVTIPSGVTTLTFTLDTPIAEIHGQSAPFSAIWVITNLTGTQITTPTLPTNMHWLTANNAADGSGTVLTGNAFQAIIINGTATTIDIQFNNRTGSPAYLSNNGDQVPFLVVYGYAVKENDGYVTQNDAGSIGLRRQRALATQLNWVQDRITATDLAGLLASMLSRPRAEVKMNVAGDPRRQPGQLATIADAQGTAADGTWRILDVQHNIDGPKYTQDLSLVFVGPVAVWDDVTTPWDYGIWGE